MIFNSFDFAIFLPIVFIFYWCLPHKFRWFVMLVASYYFYMCWKPKYVLLIFLTTCVSYAAAILLERQSDKNRKKFILFISAVFCLGVLFFFKYFNFVSEAFADVLSLFFVQVNPVTLDLLLPVGVSFYTFQTLSYVIDVYRGEISAEKHFGYYAVFISFFPQLVAGPIERTSDLLPQIKKKHNFNYEQATYGMKLMAWGFFKKIVIADTLSYYVKNIYNTPYDYMGFALILATFFFTIQIYCDFSGYSDIAIGTAKLFGVNLISNFKSPYFSQSVKDFWSRWHISLSTWFRDYIYIPLGGNRLGEVRRFFNLLVTFLISGLWHGANWTFVIWGGVHGLIQAVENVVWPKNKQKECGKKSWLRFVIVFLFVSFAWIFFVSNSVEDAVYVVTHCLCGISTPIIYVQKGIEEIGLTNYEIGKIVFTISILAIYDYFALKYDCIKEISKKPVIIRYFVYMSLLLLILFLRASQEAEFVYFQF